MLQNGSFQSPAGSEIPGQAFPSFVATTSSVIIQPPVSTRELLSSPLHQHPVTPWENVSLVSLHSR